MFNVEDITPNDIMLVYNGRPGCACGCRGKYSFATSYREMASKDQGYEVGAKELDDSTVTRILNKIKKLIAQDEAYVIMLEPTYIAVETATRAYTAYFRKFDEK